MNLLLNQGFGFWLTLALWLALVVLIFIEIKLFRSFRKFTSQKDQQWSGMQKQYEIRGYGILRKAYKRAAAILGQAELEEVKIVADNKTTLLKLEELYKSQIENSQKLIQDNLGSELGKTEEEFVKFLDDLKARSVKQDDLNQGYIKARADQTFTKLESNLAEFLQSTEQKSALAVQQELQAARQLIDTYKTQQLAFIDENILAILERTLSLVLIKKLTLRDQLDLIYEALERAKVEKFIV